jgi:hypothetical protein
VRATVRSQLRLQNEGRDDVQPEVEKEGKVSDHSRDCKTRAETTYGLEVERQGDMSLRL